MSESTLTPQTAPRDLEGLTKETPYKLRLLVSALGMLQAEEHKMAWHQLQTPETRAAYVLKLLQAWDQANPGAATPPPPAAPATPAQPAPAAPPATPSFAMPFQQPGFAPPAPQQGFAPPAPAQPGFAMPTGFTMPQPVAPVPAAAMGAPGAPPPVAAQTAQAAQVAAGAAEGKTTTKRQPRNAGAAAPAGGGGDPELGAQITGMMQTILQGLSAEHEQRVAWQKQVTEMLEEASSAKTSRVTALEAKYTELTQALVGVSQALQNQQSLQIWTLMAFLTLAEGQTGGSVLQLLKSAIDDSAMFSKLVDQATGKA